MKASLIITTRNRAAHLQQTLAAFRGVEIPAGLQAELVVVDNGSIDETAGVVRAEHPGPLRLRYVREDRRGQCHARNRGLAETRGDFILFVDDDVRPPRDLLAGMCQPMLEHGPCGVAGGVRLAPHLLRPWMTPTHRSWLASSEWLDAARPRGMVGANMAFSREVLARVPAFDAELGPGALGFSDDQLFALQLLEAGYRIHGRLDVWVEHHFEERRLLRGAWLESARGRARSHAYRGHHWEHWRSRSVRLRLAHAGGRLLAWRMRNRFRPNAEGAPLRELELEFQFNLYRAHLRESRRVRNYAYRGLVKHATASASAPAAPALAGAAS